ncbi:Fcf2 pre-rRNA processing, partial [Ramicandelaber brevisporus]
TAGKKWFDMQAVEMTPELEQDLAVLRMRGVLDKTRHFKRTSKKDKMLQTKYMQVGTVVEGATEFYSSRLTKKQRKPTLVDQLLADHETRSYFKGKVKDI